MRAGEHKAAPATKVSRRTGAVTCRKRVKIQEKGKIRKRDPRKIRHRRFETVDEERLRKIIAEAVDGLEGVSAEQVMTATMRNLYDGISEKEVATALIISTRVMIDREPNYSQAAARMLMDSPVPRSIEFP